MLTRKNEKKKHIFQWIGLAVIILYFIFAAFQYKIFQGDIFKAYKIDSPETEVVCDGWEKKLEFTAAQRELKYFEMTYLNPKGDTAQGHVQAEIKDSSGKSVWKKDFPASEMRKGIYARGIQGTVYDVNKKLKKGASYNLSLKAVDMPKEQNITARRPDLTMHYYGFNTIKFCMLLGAILMLAVLLWIPNKLNEKWNLYLSRAMFAVTPVLAFVLLERFNQTSIRNLGVFKSSVNLLVYILLLAFFFLITNRTKIASFLTIITVSLLGLANYFVVSFRGIDLMPIDFTSIRTAANVAAGYEYSINTAILWNGVLILGFLIVLFRLNAGKGLKKKQRLIPAAVFAGMLLVNISVFSNTQRLREWGIKIKLFNPSVSCKRNGYAAIFTASLKFLVAEKPEGYSEEKVEQIMKPYVKKAEEENRNINVSGKKTTKQTPNVIAVMNESFSDLSVLGDFKTNQDYMPFYHSLKKNTIKGNMYMSSFGGQTANSEFEFLTGSSMAFLPGGSVAYQYQVKDELGSLTTTLKEQGYQGMKALHPYLASGYNREVVYPLLGFSDFLSDVDFKEPEMLRRFISDKENYKKVIEEYEKAKEKDSTPYYMFNVTVQNHGGYDKGYTNFNQKIHIADGKGDEIADRYLSLVKESDSAFEYLVRYFEKVKEPTVIVMFGDHQPSLDVEFYNKVNNGSAQRKQKVPFVIWANYDIKEQTVNDISPNYLGAFLVNTLNLDETPYEKYLLKLHKKYPVVTSHVYMDANRQLHTIDTLDDLPEDLKEYWMVQYYHLFAKDKRDDSLFFLKE